MQVGDLTRAGFSNYRSRLTVFHNIAGDAASSLSDVVSSAAADAASIADSTTPLLNLAGDLSVAEAAVQSLGPLPFGE